MKIIIFCTAFIISFPMVAQMQMQVDPGLKEHRLEVSNKKKIFKNQNLRVGEYYTTSVYRSWTKSRSSYEGFGIDFEEGYLNLIGTEYTKKNQTLQFTLTNGDLYSQVFCASDFSSADKYIGENPNSIWNLGMDILGNGGSASSYYFVELHTKGSEGPWQLILDNRATQKSPGTYHAIFLKNDTEFYRLIPENKVEDPKKGKQGKIPFGSIGFKILNSEEETVASISLMEPSMVWIKDLDPEKRFVLASLCTALLLQEQID